MFNCTIKKQKDIRYGGNGNKVRLRKINTARVHGIIHLRINKFQVTYFTFAVFSLETFPTRTLKSFPFIDPCTSTAISAGIGMTLVLFCGKDNCHKL